MKKAFLIIATLGLFLNTFAQFGGAYDLQLRSRFTGGEGSDASLYSMGFDYNLKTYMFKQGQKGILKIGLNYSYANLSFSKNIQTDVADVLSDFHSTGLNLMFIKQINQKWSFIGFLNPQLSSNFTGKLSWRDFYLNGAAFWSYSRKPNNRLTFGLAYSNSMGIPFPVPIISYWKKFNDSWEMNLGFPRTNLTHNFNEKSQFTIYTEFDGYNAKISEELPSTFLAPELETNSINYIDIISGLEYVYKAKKFNFSINAGYTLDRQFQLFDKKFDEVYKFEMKNNLSFKVGVGFNL